MKRITIGICTLAAFAALSLPSLAEGNPWNGSWKIDASTMKYDGPTFSVKTDPGGFTVTRDGKAMPRVICDGKPHPDDDFMTTCNKSGENYTLWSTKDGKVADKEWINFSDGGKIETRKLEMHPSDGSSPYTITSTAKWISGGHGSPSVWKATGFTESQDTGILSIDVKGDMIAFKETDNDKPIMCKLDGTPTKFNGRSMSTKLDGSHTLKVTYRAANGKLQRENTFVLSANGKTIHETDVTPEPSPSRMSVWFHKS